MIRAALSINNFILVIILIIVLLNIGWAQDWPAFQKDAFHTGVSRDEIPETPSILWSADVQRVDATPIVSSGLVYALAGNGSIWAFDKETGDLRWRSQMDGWVFQISTPACSGDKIFAATDSGLLAAFDALTGQKLWEHLLTDKRFEAPLTCADGRLYLGEGSAYGSGEKRFFCFYENGTECWNIGYNQETGRFEDRGWSTPVGFCTSTPVVWNGRVYLGAGEHGHNGRLVCLNDSDGEPIWSYPVEAGVKASPAVSTARDRPRILFTTATVNGSVYCIEDQGDETRLLWKLNPPDDGYILGGVAISDGRVYFGTEGGQVHGKLYCLSDEDGWPQFHLNPQHTGSSASRAPMSNQTAWISEEIGAQPGSSVSVADGRVYVNCVDNLTCLDQHSGGILWTFPFKAAGDYAFGFSPVCDKGRVFFTSDRTYCLNASDGKELWSFCPPTGRFAVDGSPSVAEGRVVVSDWDGHHYYCLNEWTGEELWNFAVDGNAQSTPTIDQERVIFGGWEWGLGGKIYCVSLKNGSEIWNLSTRNSPCGSATIHEGVVYMATYNFEGDGDLLALSLDNGSVLWKAQISPTDSTPAWADGRVYICGGCEGFSDLHTYCFDALSGELIWRTPAEEKIGDWRCSPACADGLIIAGRPRFTDYSGTFALNASTGDIIWSYPEGGSSPAVAEGMVFTVGDGRVYAFKDGER